jgi:hypothetical protein
LTVGQAVDRRLLALVKRTILRHLPQTHIDAMRLRGKRERTKI